MCVKLPAYFSPFICLKGDSGFVGNPQIPGIFQEIRMALGVNRVIYEFGLTRSMLMKAANIQSKIAGFRFSRIAIAGAGFMLVLFCVISLASSPTARAQRYEGRAIARVLESRGNADFQEPGREWRNAQPGMDLPPEFEFRTRGNAEVILEFAEGQRVTVGDDSLVQVRASGERDRLSRIELTLRMGVIRARIEGNGNRRAEFNINTPNARIDAQGGQFAIRYEERRQTSRVAVEDGQVEVHPTNSAIRWVPVRRGESIELTPRGMDPFRGNFDRWDDDRGREPGGPPPGMQPPPMGGAPTGGVCIAEGSSMASTDRNNHFRWAREHNPQEIEANARMKLEMLFRCNLLDENQLANFFADISVIVARDTPNPACFNGDRGTVGTDPRRHREWARDKGREVMLENVEWKVTAALHCMDRDKQAALFADVSVAIAQGRVKM